LPRPHGGSAGVCPAGLRHPIERRRQIIKLLIDGLEPIEDRRDDKVTHRRTPGNSGSCPPRCRSTSWRWCLRARLRFGARLGSGATKSDPQARQRLAQTRTWRPPTHVILEARTAYTSRRQLVVQKIRIVSAAPVVVVLVGEL
jgi:hypothetical protein